MVYHCIMKLDLYALAVAAALLLPGATAAQEPGSVSDVPDEQQIEEREQAQQLRRAHKELEARRAEAARKLEAEQFRQAEVGRLQAIVSGAARRESYLGHEAYWTQRERDSLSQNPADLSAMARRGNIDHQLYRYQSELERAGTLRQGVSPQLNGLQLR